MTYKQLKENLEAHKAKRDSILYRNQLIEHQKRQNYINEYDRIRGFRENLKGRFPIGTAQKLMDRESELQYLAHESLSKINGEIPY